MPESPDDWSVLQTIWFFIGSGACLSVFAMLYHAFLPDKQKGE